MATQELLTLFLASPGDVASERDLVVRIVEEYNATVGAAHGVRVQVVRWETDARPGWGKDGQAMINGLIEGRNHALFVVIFWNRFGTPTPRAKSGTLEEFNLAVKQRLGKRPEIMLYFNSAPATLNSEKELDQRKEVLAFKAGIKDGLYGTYKGKAAFAKKFRADYGKWLMEEIGALEKPPRRSKTNASAPQPLVAAPTPKPAPRKTPGTAPKLKTQPILLDGDLFFAEKVVESGANWTILLRPQDPGDDRKIRALGGQNQWHQGFALAYDLQAGRAQATKPGERSSDANGVLWTLELRFSPLSSNAAHTVNFGNMTAAEIAQKKAEWLLLAQKPALPAPKNAWETRDSWAERQIMGQGKDGQPILPPLWKLCGGDKIKFKAIARLSAVNRLLNEGVCEHIDALEIGTVRVGKVAVTFRGTRSSVVSRAAQIVEVKGTCPLEITP